MNIFIWIEECYQSDEPLIGTRMKEHGRSDRKNSKAENQNCKVGE